MSIFKQLPEVAEILGGTWTAEGIRRELKHGIFRGIGGKKGSPVNGIWLCDDDDIAAMVKAIKRNRMGAESQDLDTGATASAFPSGRVKGSKSARRAVPA